MLNSLALQYEIDTDSIGNVVCKKAEELEAAVTVLARHRRVWVVCLNTCAV